MLAHHVNVEKAEILFQTLRKNEQVSSNSFPYPVHSIICSRRVSYVNTYHQHISNPLENQELTKSHVGK